MTNLAKDRLSVTSVVPLLMAAVQVQEALANINDIKELIDLNFEDETTENENRQNYDTRLL